MRAKKYQETSFHMNYFQLMEEFKREKRYNLENQEMPSSFAHLYVRKNK